MTKTLTKKQFKDKLTNPKLFVVREKVRQLRKELVKINWKVYSKYVSARRHQIRLRLINTKSGISWSDNSASMNFSKGLAVGIVENIFLPALYNGTIYSHEAVNFTVYITIE